MLKSLTMWLRILQMINPVLYWIIIIVLSYITLGIITGCIFIITLNLRPKVILSKHVAFHSKIFYFFIVCIEWPVCIHRIFRLLKSQFSYISSLLKGRGIKIKLMKNNIYKIKTIYYQEGIERLRELSTREIYTSQEVLYKKKSDSDELQLVKKVNISGMEDRDLSNSAPVDSDFDDPMILEFTKFIKNNGLTGLENIPANVEKEFNLGGIDYKIGLVFPEDSLVCNFSEMNSLYVFKHIDNEDDKIKLQDKLINEFHYDEENNIILVIDYEYQESYAIKKDVQLFSCKFNGNDPENNFEKVKFDDLILTYHYNSNNEISSISSNQPEDTNYLRIDDVDDERSVTTITYPVPFIRSYGKVYVTHDDYKIYCTESITKYNDVIESRVKEYRVFTNKEEEDLKIAFKRTVLNIG